ncbi:MAG: AraC family transcriptional regulator [Actinobacteria bacterium HGW-Actinobacteria-5]|jgi:AraC-like DNA-binding protein|nr:MAG: AraC family transcriptional regulator [Actinobacteria bacterium HGW-Actinobacteria-5]
MSVLKVARLEPVNPDRYALGLCVSPLNRPDGCWAHSRGLEALRCGFHEAILCTDGEGTFLVEGEVQYVRPGTLIWLRPGQVHTPFPDVSGVALCFLDEVGGDAAELVHGQCWQLDGVEFGDISECFDLLQSQYRRYAFADTGPCLARGELLLSHLIQAMLLRLGQIRPDRQRDVHWNRLAEDFADQVQLHFAESRSTDDYAAGLHCSTRTLARACIDAFGQTPKEFVDSYRARTARDLLAHTDLSVQAIGRRVGFDDPANFGRFFTRMVGSSPGAYRAAD